MRRTVAILAVILLSTALMLAMLPALAIPPRTLPGPVRPPRTTTTAAPTTTTLPPLPPLPATIPMPPISSSLGFRIGLNIEEPRTSMWQAGYLYKTLYTSTDPNTGWLAGDRVAYGCAYMFLQHNNQIVGRTTFRAVPEASSYTVVNDTYMDEGARYYNGTLAPAGTVQVPALECPAVIADYTSNSNPDQRPVVSFINANKYVELRDYRSTVAAPGVTFEVIEVITTPFYTHSSISGDTLVTSRVTVLAKFNGVPTVVIYYDGLGTGKVISTLSPTS